MITLPGYDIIEQIYKGRRSAIFRALRFSDWRPVIIKIPVQGFPALEHVTRLRREFDLGSALADAHIITYDAFEDSPHGQFIVEEDFDAVALTHLIPRMGSS